MNPGDLFVNHWAEDEQLEFRKPEKPVNDRIAALETSRLDPTVEFQLPSKINDENIMETVLSTNTADPASVFSSVHSLILEDPLGNPFDSMKSSNFEPRLSQAELEEFASPISTVTTNQSVLKVALTDPLQNPANTDDEVKKPILKQPMRKKLSTKYDFTVQVGDAIKAGDLLSTYTEYNINSTTNDPSYRNQQASVMRRYSDFLWLFNQLCNLYVGVIIPPVPDKLAFGRFQDEFVEKRRIELDIFLKRVVMHPILQLDESLRAFLESINFSSDKKTMLVPSILGAELLPVAPLKPFPEVGDNDLTLSEFRRDLIILEDQMVNLETTCISILETRKQYQASIQALSSSFQALSTSKLLSDVVAAKLKKISVIQNKIIPILNELREFEKTHWLVTLGEYIRTVGSIKIQFQIRQKCYRALQECELTLAKKQTALDKLIQGSQIRQDKISEYSRDCEQCKKVVMQDSNELKKITRVLITELERFKELKFIDFKDTMKSVVDELVKSQRLVRLANKMKSCWQSYFDD